MGGITCDMFKEDSLFSCSSAANVASVAANMRLLDMFPDSDPVLVESIHCETLNVQQTVHILLSLCSSSDSNHGEQQLTPNSDVLRDPADCPVLMQSDGVPIAGPGTCTGETWSQRAKAVAGTQPPKKNPEPRICGWQTFSRGTYGDQHGSHQYGTDVDNEYEAHQSRGKRRAVNRLKYPRPPRSNRFALNAKQVDVSVEVSEDPPGCAPAWRTFRFDNRL